MDKTPIIEKGRQFVLLIGQIIILFLCLGFISFYYEENILPDKRVAETFAMTNCTILNKTLSKKGHVIHRYRADFIVSYAGQMGSYKDIASGNGLDYSFTTNEASQEELLDEFNVGETYPCWYDPERPQLVVLVLRHNWASTSPLIVPTVIGIMMLYYIFKAFFQGIEYLVVRHRNKHK